MIVNSLLCVLGVVFMGMFFIIINMIQKNKNNIIEIKTLEFKNANLKVENRSLEYKMYDLNNKIEEIRDLYLGLKKILD